MLWVHRCFQCCLASNPGSAWTRPTLNRKTSVLRVTDRYLFLCMFVPHYKCLLPVKCCGKQAKHMQIVGETTQNSFSKWNTTCHGDGPEYNEAQRGQCGCRGSVAGAHTRPWARGASCKVRLRDGWTVSWFPSPGSPALRVSSQQCLGPWWCVNCNQHKIQILTF